jgi:hypothetical protein
MQRFSPFLVAIFVSLLIVIAGLLHALKQHPPYAPQVSAEQQAHGALKGEENASGGSPSAAKANEEHGGKHAEKGEEDGTEFWPSVFGVRLKITDSLLAVFTFGLLVFTGLLWRSTHKLWFAGEKQLRLAREALVADQRAWLVVTHFHIESLDFGRVVKGSADASADIVIKFSNVGRTPALNVNIELHMIGDYATEANEVKTFATKIFRGDGPMVASGETVEEEYTLSVSGSELYRYGGRGGIRPLIVGCITYHILQDSEFRQTGFGYRPERADGGRIWIPDGSLTANDLRASASGGGFAN